MSLGLAVSSPIKEYKELIALMVFFLAGTLWVFGYFATKAQLKELRCITVANIDFLQGEMDSKSLDEMLLNNMKDQLNIRVLSESEQLKSILIQLELDNKDLTNKLNEAKELKSRTMKALKSGQCNES